MLNLKSNKQIVKQLSTTKLVRLGSYKVKGHAESVQLYTAAFSCIEKNLNLCSWDREKVLFEKGLFENDCESFPIYAFFPKEKYRKAAKAAIKELRIKKYHNGILNTMAAMQYDMAGRSKWIDFTGSQSLF